MNLILLFPDDFTDAATVRLSGRRLRHVVDIHRAAVGDELAVGLLDGAMGRGRLTKLEGERLELEVQLDQPPPPKLPLTLLLALPRPKVLNRALAAAASLGVARIVLLNAWKVEKAYWNSPKLEPDNLRQQLVLGLEQAKDTVLPDLRVARFFRPFVEDELPLIAQGHVLLAGHPGGPESCPRALDGPAMLAIGPEGGWIDSELESLQRAGFLQVDLGPRILRVETALAALVGRLT
jgi:RsmE family RNA methyltransferase